MTTYKNIKDWMEAREKFRPLPRKRQMRDVKMRERFVIIDDREVPSRGLVVSVSTLWWSGSEVCPAQNLKLTIDREMSKSEVETFKAAEDVLAETYEAALMKLQRKTRK